MMGHIMNQVRQEVALAMGNRMSVSIGTVKSYDHSRYAVTVMLQPENIETGWMPLASAWVGNNCGLFLAPNIGDTVLVYFVDGSIEAGIVGPGIFTAKNFPLDVQAGEAWLVHQSGSFLKLHNDGSVELNATAGLKVTGDVSVTGKVTTTGDVKSSAGNVIDQKGSIDAMRTTYNTHTHTDPQGGVSGVPNVPMT